MDKVIFEMEANGRTIKSINPLITGIEKYPEFKAAVNQLVPKIMQWINSAADPIKSEMPYKRQFLLEEVIRELSERV